MTWTVEIERERAQVDDEAHAGAIDRTVLRIAASSCSGRPDVPGAVVLNRRSSW